MPNWCEGNIRVRGTYIKIVKFFRENLKALKYDKKGTIQDIPVTVREDSDYYTVIRKPDDDCQDEFWINGTNRQFINAKEIELIDDSDDEFQEIVICIDGFKGAWSIDLEHFGPMAEKYGVDIKIFGFERGIQFAELAEFRRDGTVYEKTVRYNDWDWECPCPNLGG